MCSNGSVGSVLTKTLVKLGLNAQELLQVVSGEVQVGDVATNNVGTDLTSANIFHQEPQSMFSVPVTSFTRSDTIILG